MKLIKNKYKENVDKWSNFIKFFEYFDTVWLKKININDWNLYLLAKNGRELDKLDKIFFTNNIVESANSRLNINIKKNKNNKVNIFSIEINKLINLYYTSKNYNSPIFSKTKAIVNYIFETNFNEKINLINNKDLKNIYIKYKNNIDKNNSLNIEDIISSSFDKESNDNIEVNSNNAYLNQEEEISNDNLYSVKGTKRKSDYLKDEDDNKKEDIIEKHKKIPKYFINNKNIEKNIIINNNFLNNELKIDNLEGKKLNIELNLHEYEICINHIDYLIRCYEEILKLKYITIIVKKIIKRII